MYKYPAVIILFSPKFKILGINFAEPTIKLHSFSYFNEKFTRLDKKVNLHFFIFLYNYHKFCEIN